MPRVPALPVLATTNRKMSERGPAGENRRCSFALFIGHPDQRQIFDELLGLPPEVVPIGLALIGKPAVDPTAERGTSRFKERRRSPDDVVRWQRWS